MKDHIDELNKRYDEICKVKDHYNLYSKLFNYFNYIEQEPKLKMELQSIFYKNSPLHDGAIVIEDAKITATRVILPVSNDRNIPLRFGLRHRAAIGITEKTDALALVVSEETGQISYIKDGEFRIFDNEKDLVKKLQNDMQ